MCLPALAVQGDTFQKAVDARRAGNGTPGATGFGLTRDRTASAVPRTQLSDLARLTQAPALETTPLLEGGDGNGGGGVGDGKEEDDEDEKDENADTIAASAALGAMLSRVKGMAAANASSEGPSEEDLAQSFFEECAKASNVNDAKDAKKLEEKEETEEAPTTTVMASVLLAALDTQAALLADTDAVAGPSTSGNESGTKTGSSADRKETKAQAYLLFTQSAVLQKLQATPPLRDALLTLSGSGSSSGGASLVASSSSSSGGNISSSSSSSGRGENPITIDNTAGLNGTGLVELDWLVFCEAVKDLMKWNEAVF